MFATKKSAAWLSVMSNSLLILLKIIAGIITGSISILAEALHSLLDLVAAVIAFFAVRISDRPADEDHAFGHGKVENVSGTIEAILIFVAAIFIIVEAIKRLQTGAKVEVLELGIAVMAVSVIVNIVISRRLVKVSRSTDSVALEADAAHLTTDVWTSVGTLCGLTIARLTGWDFLDPVVAMMVAMLIMKAAWDVTHKSFGGLIDTRLPPSEETAIRETILEHNSQLVGLHELRSRKSGSHRYIDLHLVMPRQESVAEAHAVCDHLESDLKARLPNLNVTIHVEPCDSACEQCGLGCEASR
jgi:cation diffusion facilitator family transporter